MPSVPEGAKKPSDRLKAEAENAADETVTEFKGHKIRVLPFLDWERHAIQHVNVLNIDGWAEAAIHPDDLKTFQGIKSTMGEALQFIKDAAAHAGADLGELGASLGS